MTATYCLFCRSGQESKVMERLRHDGIHSFSPFVERLKPSAAGIKKSLCRLLPGYVFMESDQHLDRYEICNIPGVLRILSYSDGTCALRNSDMTFIRWLKRFNAVIERSLAVRVGTKLHFIEGPLSNMNGNIVNVNKKRRVAAVRFGDADGLFQTVWCSFDYVEAYSDTSGIMA